MNVNDKPTPKNDEALPFEEEDKSLHKINIAGFFEKSRDANLSFLKTVWQQENHNKNDESSESEKPKRHEKSVDQHDHERTISNSKRQTSKLDVHKRNEISSAQFRSFDSYSAFHQWGTSPSDAGDEDAFSDDDENKYVNNIYGGPNDGFDGHLFFFRFTRFHPVRMVPSTDGERGQTALSAGSYQFPRPVMDGPSPKLMLLQTLGQEDSLWVDHKMESRAPTQMHIGVKEPSISTENSDELKHGGDINKLMFPNESSSTTEESQRDYIPKEVRSNFEQAIRISCKSKGVRVSTSLKVKNIENSSPNATETDPSLEREYPKKERNEATEKERPCLVSSYDEEATEATAYPSLPSESSHTSQKEYNMNQTNISMQNVQISQQVEQQKMYRSKVGNISLDENPPHGAKEITKLKLSIDTHAENRMSPPQMPNLIQSSMFWRGNPEIKEKPHRDLGKRSTSKIDAIDTGNCYDYEENKQGNFTQMPAEFDNIFNSSNYHNRSSQSSPYANNRGKVQDGRDLETEDHSMYCHCHHGTSWNDDPPNYYDKHVYHDYEDEHKDYFVRHGDSIPEYGHEHKGCGNCHNCKSHKIMEMMQTLSESIGREIHDVLPDGNCMFRSITDQLRMQGELEWTAMSLRTKAVEYLRSNPYQEDGTHYSEFLPLDGDTWSEYLQRMNKDTEWGDNIILRGLAEVIGRNICIISAFGDVHNQTTVSPSVTKQDQGADDIFLGHINDQHYVSLRRKDWKDTWFKNAETFDHQKNEKTNYESDAAKKALKSSDLSSTSDTFSRVPHLHFNFLLRRVMPKKCIATMPKDFALEMLNQLGGKGLRPMLYGSEADGLAVFRIRKTSSSNFNGAKEKRFELPNIAYFRETQEAVEYLDKDRIKSKKQYIMHYDGLAPGYLRLHCPSHGELYPDIVRKVNGGVYLSREEYKKRGKSYSIFALKCKEWPAFMISNWIDRVRPSGWPDQDLVQEIVSQYIVIAPFAHPESRDRDIRDIEWQFCFAKQEYTLAKSLDIHQKYCFHVFQLLVCYLVGESPLKRYFLKNIFFRALENIFVNNWKLNPGVCVLYLIDQTINALNMKYLEHYFVSNNNLIGWFSDDCCQYLSSKLRAIRRFPIISIVLLAEGHGLTTSWIADLVMDDTPKFLQHRDPQTSTLEVFVPAYIKEIQTEIHFNFFRDAVDMFWDSFEEISKTVELPFKDFLRQSLSEISMSDQWWFSFFLDFMYSKGILNEMFQHHNGILLCEISGEEKDAGLFNSIYIPHEIIEANYKSESYIDQSEHSKHIAFLRTLCTELAKERFYDHSVFYYRILIRRMKENIPVRSKRHNRSELNENNIKIAGRENDEKVDKLSTSFRNFRSMELFYTYIRMFNTYQSMGQPELFTEHVEDLESLSDTIGTRHSFKQLAEIWWILGSREKYEEAMDKYSRATIPERNSYF